MPETSTSAGAAPAVEAGPPSGRARAASARRRRSADARPLSPHLQRRYHSTPPHPGRSRIGSWRASASAWARPTISSACAWASRPARSDWACASRDEVAGHRLRVGATTDCQPRRRHEPPEVTGGRPPATQPPGAATESSPHLRGRSLLEDRPGPPPGRVPSRCGPTAGLGAGRHYPWRADLFGSTSFDLMSHPRMTVHPPCVSRGPDHPVPVFSDRPSPSLSAEDHARSEWSPKPSVSTALQSSVTPGSSPYQVHQREFWSGSISDRKATGWDDLVLRQPVPRRSSALARNRRRRRQDSAETMGSWSPTAEDDRSAVSRSASDAQQNDPAVRGTGPTVLRPDYLDVPCSPPKTAVVGCPADWFGQFRSQQVLDVRGSVGRPPWRGHRAVGSEPHDEAPTTVVGPGGDWLARTVRVPAQRPARSQLRGRRVHARRLEPDGRAGLRELRRLHEDRRAGAARPSRPWLPRPVAAGQRSRRPGRSVLAGPGGAVAATVSVSAGGSALPGRPPDRPRARQSAGTRAARRTWSRDAGWRPSRGRPPAGPRTTKVR